MRNTEIAQKWERLDPKLGDEGWVTIESPFPSNMSDEDIIREFQTKMLRPKPSFSIVAALTSHRMPFLIGAVLVAIGLVGCAGLTWRARRAKREVNVSPI